MYNILFIYVDLLLLIYVSTKKKQNEDCQYIYLSETAFKTKESSHLCIVIISKSIITIIKSPTSPSDFLFLNKLRID